VGNAAEEKASGGCGAEPFLARSDLAILPISHKRAGLQLQPPPLHPVPARLRPRRQPGRADRARERAGARKMPLAPCTGLGTDGTRAPPPASPFQVTTTRRPAAAGAVGSPRARLRHDIPAH